MNVRAGLAAGNEKTRISKLSESEFVEKFEYQGDVSVIDSVKQHLYLQLNKYIIGSAGMGAVDSIDLTIAPVKGLSIGDALGSTYGFVHANRNMDLTMNVVEAVAI